ncbi:transposase family protein [Micromonospora sp. DR5-3]|uniref:transposase family protein n=1 Tax=unclassified Micromonospora TaxID=2617518 RepID=UPI0011D2FCB5|nr:MULTISPECIES: transposase family protein [unclassified Micromonospora]MCW3815110.1 transposase family protein [Micromonospora sp. DR5-3]TYC21990.1 transposase family protein [Micromonospora sp. MP36]
MHQPPLPEPGLTSLTGPQLSALAVRVAAALPPTTGRPQKLSLTDRILVTYAAVRTNLTTRMLAAVFRISQTMVMRALRHLQRHRRTTDAA